MEKIKKEIEYFDFMNCICCGKTIKLIEIGSPDKFQPGSSPWLNGSVKLISAPYGSSHDGDQFYLGICDVCITEGYRNGRLRYVGDYMSGYIDKFTEEEKLSQNRLRNREYNLNNLL
jgi:hypothetical protein